MNQLRTTNDSVKIVDDIRKSSCEHRKEKISDPLCSLKKTTRDGSRQTVCEPRTNYTNIVFANHFANEMFASVHTA